MKRTTSLGRWTVKGAPQKHPAFQPITPTVPGHLRAKFAAYRDQGFTVEESLRRAKAA